MTKQSIQTTVGLLAGDLEATYHVNWLTYAHDRERGCVGLEGIVEKAYGKHIEMGECANDTDMSIDVSKKEPLDDFDQDELGCIIAKGYFPEYHLSIVMQELVNRDVIPAGKYIVTMSW